MSKPPKIDTLTEKEKKAIREDPTRYYKGKLLNTKPMSDFAEHDLYVAGANSSLTIVNEGIINGDGVISM